jgi:hypothetical protein
MWFYGLLHGVVSEALGFIISSFLSTYASLFASFKVSANGSAIEEHILLVKKTRTRLPVAILSELVAIHVCCHG